LSLCKQNPTKPYRLRIWGIKDVFWRRIWKYGEDL